MRCAAAVAHILVVLLPPLHGQIRTYVKMEIDPGSRVARFSDEVPEGLPTVEYFQQSIQQFRQQTRSTVDRVIPIGNLQPDLRTEVFYLNQDRVVSQRRKFQELFSASGTPLVAESTYQYLEPGYGDGSIGFSVRAETTSIRREPPKTVEDLPLSAKPLNVVTVIRIAKFHGIDTAAIATHNQTGELFSVTVDPLKADVYLPPSGKAQTVDDVIRESINQFGFPLKFVVDEFQTKPTPLYERTDSPAPLTVVSFHYARNRWVRQYIFDPSRGRSKHEMRILEFRYSAQDESLGFFDDTLVFGPRADERMHFVKK